jgi:asparagine synthase (glutamine-hydrolysing)
VQNKDKITRRQYLDTKTYLPGDILTKVDRTSMMVSLEARVPLLDHKLVEFAAKIPARIKIKGRKRKYLFKKAAERILPKEVIYRPKMGFAVPIAEWIKTEWQDMSQELLLSKRALARKNFNPSFVTRLINEHKRGRRNHDMLLWTLMVLELWYRQFIDYSN